MWKFWPCLTKTAGTRPPSPESSPVVKWNKFFLEEPGGTSVTIASNSILNSSLQYGVDQTWSPFVMATLPFLEKMVSTEMVKVDWSINLWAVDSLLLTFYYTYCSIISTVWKKNPQFSVIGTVQSPKKYFNYMKIKNTVKKIGFIFVKYRTIKKIWGQTSISTILIIEC